MRGALWAADMYHFANKPPGMMSVLLCTLKFMLLVNFGMVTHAVAPEALAYVDAATWHQAQGVMCACIEAFHA
jgi:hypothetical protein